MRKEDEMSDSKFRESLFNLYIGRQKAADSFRSFNKLMGGTGVVLSVAAGGPVGWGLALTAGTITIINEVRMLKQIYSNNDEHGKVISDVKKYKRGK